jgi:hypothetical protein
LMSSTSSCSAFSKLKAGTEINSMMMSKDWIWDSNSLPISSQKSRNTTFT